MKYLLFSFLKFSIQGSLIGAAMVMTNLALAVPVNINTADAETIADALNGVGEKTAIKIIEYRNSNGPFKAVDDLTNIKGIGEKKLARFKEDVRLKAFSDNTQNKKDVKGVKKAKN